MIQRKKGFLWIISLCILSAGVGYFSYLLLRPSASLQPRAVTIGIVNLTPALNGVAKGFKSAMSDFGYTYGENVTYIDDGPTGSIEKLGPAIQKLRKANVDLIFSISTPATMHANKSVTGTDIPVVFAPVNDPVLAGVVQSIRSPGGNCTGIKVRGFVSGGLEWLRAIAPDTKRLFVPHNPNDKSAVLGLTDLKMAMSALGVEAVVHKVHRPGDMKEALANIPDSVDAIFLLPDNLVLAQIAVIAAVARERKLPLFSVSSSQARAGAVIAYGPEFFEIGKQAARLANQILKGSKPAELPVETAAFFLTINLNIAKEIGLDIRDDLLRQADNVIR